MDAILAPSGSERLVELLSSPTTYPDLTNAAEIVETHISWVFLTDRYAYKLKKPVRFEFLDFSTPDRRRQACLDEVRLNKRLAPDVYLAVLPVTQRHDKRLELNGQGQAVDWVVQMRRLPAKSALSVVLREKKASSNDAKTIARHLTNFYSRLLPKPISPDAYREILERHIRANGVTLQELFPAEISRIRRIQAAQLRYVNVEAELFGDRVTGGRIVEGHGDLRPEHIYLNGTPTIIDCIEFSDELRTVDIADELSFLCMECQHLGEREFGEIILAEYQKLRGDRPPESLFSFYRGYRASVRAKVAALRGEQLDGAKTVSNRLGAEYLQLAEEYANKLGPPMLLVVGGLMGSGKSTLAAKLADVFAIELLSTDHVRHDLIGSSEAPAAYGEGNYRPDVRSRVYDELFRKAEELLTKGESVVLDGTFLTSCLRDRAYNLAEQHAAQALHIQCKCPRETAYARIQSRHDAGQSESEARTELYDLQAQDLETPWADEPAITIDTTRSLSQQIRDVCDELKRLASP